MPKPSDLCPLCPAKDHIARWLPHQNALAEIHMQILADMHDQVQSVILQGWAKSTKLAYGTGLLVYHVFCDSRDIPETDRTPTSSALISMFVSALAGSYAGQTIQGYVYRVHAWHTLNSLPWSLHECQINTMLKGAVKLAPPSVKQILREPITKEMIEVIRTCLQKGDPLDTAFFTCLTMVFYSTACIGEFTLKKLNAFNPQLHIMPAQVCNNTDHNGFHTKVFALPSTKANPKGKEVNWAKQNGTSDPSEAFEQHMQLNNPPITGPLFAYKHRAAHRPLTRQAFISRLKRLLKWQVSSQYTAMASESEPH
ncbi:hypothetical protein ID866_11176 [Astraeus odoratus]|nr:hypothetical protein ID866_11176 [Astraeus odoratus]